MSGEELWIYPLPQTEESLAGEIACLDCTADVSVSELYPGLFTATVAHDDTCPTYQQKQREEDG